MKLKVYNKETIIKGGIIGIGITFLVVLYLILLILIHYKCPFHELLGIYCPGCGGTRMLISFVHLDFYQSFRWNPLLFILLIVGLIYLIVNVIVYIKKKVLIVPTIKFWVFIILLLIIYMIIRNIDIFSYLVPTRIS